MSERELRERVFERLTERMACCLSLAARHHSYAEIGEILFIGARTVAADMRRVEAITGSADLGEAVRWWLDWGEDYARWLLRRLGIDPKDLVA